VTIGEVELLHLAAEDRLRHPAAQRLRLGVDGQREGLTVDHDLHSHASTFAHAFD
jgi:hypothetical protein